MTLLDVCFSIVRKWEITEEDDDYYDYWSVDDEGMFLFITCRNEPDFFTDIKRVRSSEIECEIPYIWDNPCLEKPYFIPYEELEPYLNIEVEIDSPVRYEGCQKYPLVCVRGNCDNPCSGGKKIDAYCFREVPCTNNRPDWNIWACKYPDFYSLLFDVVNFIGVCPCTDTFVVMFDFTPDAYNPELCFDYICSSMLIKDRKITVIGDSSKAKRLYKEYNKKYPTNDRQIEESISNPEENFYFKF